MSVEDSLSFATPEQLEEWLGRNHATRQELWVRLFKKGSVTPSVTWEDCVVASLAWGWIDGQRRPLDDVSYLHRLTPRRARSTWSRRNRDHAERLIAGGRMRPPGMAHVEAARRDGRWERAYAGQAEMVIPADFLAELEQVPAAREHFETLNRGNLFVIYHRLQTAVRPETRRKRIADLIARLARGEALRP